MAERPKVKAAAGTGETPSQSGLTAEQFEALPEFSEFKRVMRGILQIPKAEIDRRVNASKETSPRKNNPKAPGRKTKRRKRKPRHE